MKTLFLLLILLVNSGYSQWNAVYEPKTERDLSFAVAKGNSNFVDNNGNCYVTGYVNTFAWSYKDIVTIKYSPVGDTVWVRTYNGSENNDDEGTAITVDVSGNVYVTGYAQLTGKYKDVILMKYSSSGNLLWAKTYGITATLKEDMALGIAADASGNIYVTGYGTASDGLTDIITLKYDINGNILWSKREDGVFNNNSKGYGIVVDNAGSIVVTGDVMTENNWEDIILIKYSASGYKTWSKTFNNEPYNDEDKAWGIVVDTDNNIYVAGHTTLDWYAQNFDAIVLKFNSSGTLQWTNTYGGEGNAEDKAWGIVVDTDGSVYIAGNTTDVNLNSNYLTVKYNSAGTQQWVAEYNGTGDGHDVANAVGIVNNNGVKSIVVTGASWGTNNNHDYATVRYEITNGEQTTVNRYSLASFTEDVATDLAIMEGTVCITGYSEIIFDNNSNGSSIVTQNLNWGSSELVSGNTQPVNFSLRQNYPNPFNPSTSIEFNLPSDAKVKLTVYDILGKQVDVLINQNLSSGGHKITFNASNLSSGIYFYELSTSDGYKDIKKMTLVK